MSSKRSRMSRRAGGWKAVALLGGGASVLVLGAALVLGVFREPAHASVAIGSAAPDFTLTDATGAQRSLSDYRGKVVVLEWFNHGCPFVKKHYDSENMQGLQAEYTEKGVVWLSVNSTNVDHGDYRDPAQTLADAEEKGAAPSALLLDADGAVGKSYGAKTTPHMYVVDAEGKLVYQGAIDSVRSTDPDDIPEATNHVRVALDEVLAGQPVSTPQTQPYGCSVKY